MSLPIEDLTPRQIVSELNRFIVGQNAAKRAVAIALRNRFRRQQLPAAERDDILPKNILMIGPTGVGKTEIARRLAQLARAPFIKVEATKFTEVGYVGRDVESMVRDLVGEAIRLVTGELELQVRGKAEEIAKQKLVDLLYDLEVPKRKAKSKPSHLDNPILRQAFEMFGQKMNDGYPDEPNDLDEDQLEQDEKIEKKRRKQIRKLLDAGKLNEHMVEIEVEDKSNPFIQVFSTQGHEEMGLDSDRFGTMFPGRKNHRRVRVEEALQLIIAEELGKMIDKASANIEAIKRTEQTGIIFLDELDKVAGKSSEQGPDVSREGVQRDLLPILEGTTVATKYGQVRTDHILFIGAGAFHMSKPSDLIPELQGRLPIRVELETLTEEDFRRILREPENALTKQYQKLLSTEGVSISFTEEALDEIARIAVEVNSKTENIGARRLHTVMERLLENVLFDAPEIDEKKIVFDGEKVRSGLEGLAKNVDLSRYIL